MHALWGCTKVRQVWKRSFGWLDNNQAAKGSFADLVHLVQTKPRLFPLFTVTAWAVWHHRNKSHLHAATIPLDRLTDFAEYYLQNFAAGHVQKLPPERSVTIAVKWRPPSENFVKINFDGALFGESDCAGLGVVIHNSKGEVMAALSEKIVKPPAAKLVEIMAARCAVLFSIETGFHNSVFEGDSTLVIKLLQDRMVSHPQGGHILKDIVSYLNSLQSLSFTHVGKQGNIVAHALAQRARLSFLLRFGWSLFLQPFLLLYYPTFRSSFLMTNYLSFSNIYIYIHTHTHTDICN